MTNRFKLSNRYFYIPETICVTTLLEMKKVIEQYSVVRSSVHWPMVDLTKAFNNVNRQTLLVINVNQHFSSNTFDYIHQNQFAGVTNDPRKLGIGTRQRTVNYRLSFKHVVNKLIKCDSDMHEKYSLAAEMYNIICYDDDIGL